jgi:hypothetical protein
VGLIRTSVKKRFFGLFEFKSLFLVNGRVARWVENFEAQRFHREESRGALREESTRGKREKVGGFEKKNF